MWKDNTCVSMDREKKNPIFIVIALCKQVSYRVSNALNISDMLTTLGIYISINTTCEFVNVSSEEFHECFPPRSINFQINLILGA